MCFFFFKKTVSNFADIFKANICLKNVHKNSTERVIHLCGQHDFYSCLL